MSVKVGYAALGFLEIGSDIVIAQRGRVDARNFYAEIGAVDCSLVRRRRRRRLVVVLAVETGGVGPGAGFAGALEGGALLN